MKKPSLYIPVAFALFCLLPTSAFASKITVYLVNCISTQKTIRGSAFNGNDSLKIVQYSGTYVDYGAKGSLKCDEGGKGYCKVNVGVKDGTATSTWQNIDKNKYARITLSGGKVQFSVYSTQPVCR